MAACISPESKKALLERLEEKCPIDEDVCSDVVSLVESWPECNAKAAHHKHRAPRPRFEEDRDEQSEVDGLPDRPMGMIPVMGIPERRKARVKRPHALSKYQRHQSVCLSPGSEHTFQECVAMWRKGESMADEYKGSGMTK